MTARSDAEALDAADPLREFRGEFVIADPEVVYLDGNSLGRLPRRTADRLARAVQEEWGEGLVRSWEDWIGLAERVGDLLGVELLGADAGEVLVSDSTSVNLYKLAAAALDARPARDVIVMDEHDFPTDRYILEGLARARGLELRLVRSDPAGGPTVDDVEALLDDRVALAAFSHVSYRSAAIADVGAITAAAHGAGALVLWDLSHAVGSVPVRLRSWGVDLAVGCTYKYLNAGPGAPAFLYVNANLHDELRQPIWGWFGQLDMFAMGPRYNPQPGIGQFKVGTSPVLGILAVEEGASIVAKAGVDRLWAKGRELTDLIVELSADLGFSLRSPRDAELRGCHLALGHPEASRLSRALIAAGVICDYRAPDSVRLAPAPLYTRYVDAWEAVDRLRTVLATGAHLALDPQPGPVT